MITFFAIVAALCFARAWRTLRRETLMLRDERDTANRRAETSEARAARWEDVANQNAEHAQVWRARWRYAEMTALGVGLAIAEGRQADELATRRTTRKPRKAAAVKSS